MGLNLHSMQIKCFHVTKIKQKMARNSCGVHLGKHFLDVSIQSTVNEHNQKEAYIKQEKGKCFETIPAFSYLLDY